MATVKTAQKSEVHCHDCQTRIRIENKKIKNGVLLKYEEGGESFMAYKCNECFNKSPSLNNFRKCEVYSRVVGYLRPVQQWNVGKKQEYRERKEYKEPEECC